MKKLTTLCMLWILQVMFLNAGAQTNQLCFSSTTKPDIVSAKIEWTSNPNGTITIKTTFSKTFVDNTYGVNAIGWGTRGHTFGNLVGSDHLQLALFDTRGVKKLEFKIDYITASSTVPSGYKTLGVTGGEGQMIVGSATNVVGSRTSISENLNTFGYVLTTNSPVTNATYTPNPTFPNWIYDVWYEVTVNASAFGTDGFGTPSIAGVHASPSKTGSNTEIVIPGPCNNTLRLGNLVFNDRNGSGIRDAGEPAIPGVTINLFKDTNGDNLPDGPGTGTVIKSTVSDANGKYLFDNLVEGKYIASVPMPNGYGESPNTITGRIVAPANGQSLNPDNNIDNDNNLVKLLGPNGPGGILYTNSIKLNFTQEPTNEGDDNNGNLSFDLAICGNSRIGDFVWKDTNANGIQDAGEPGISGAKVKLTFPDGTVADTTTDINGLYSYRSLGPGNYKVTFITPAGLFASPENMGSNDAKDSDPIDGLVMVTLLGGAPDVEQNLTIDAGFNDKFKPDCMSMSLGNLVWHDDNANGMKEDNEKGVPGLTVNLYRDMNADNLPDGAAIATAITADDGTYYFSNLLPGKYIVGVNVIGSKYVMQTGGNSTPNDDKNTDNNGVNYLGGEVRTNFITLTMGGEPINDGSDSYSNLTLDIGLKDSKKITVAKSSALIGEISIDKSTMKVYPNPANNYFVININSSATNPASIRVLDAGGKIVMVKNTSVVAGSNTIIMSDINKLKKGNYQVQAFIGSERLNNQLSLMH